MQKKNGFSFMTKKSYEYHLLQNEAAIKWLVLLFVSGNCGGIFGPPFLMVSSPHKEDINKKRGPHTPIDAYSASAKGSSPSATSFDDSELIPQRKSVIPVTSLISGFVSLLYIVDRLHDPFQLPEVRAAYRQRDLYVPGFSSAGLSLFGV